MYNFTHHFNSKPLFSSATCSGLDCSRASGPPISSSPDVVLSQEKLCPLIFRQQPMGNDRVSQPEEKGGPAVRASLSTAPQAKKGARYLLVHRVAQADGSTDPSLFPQTSSGN